MRRRLTLLCLALTVLASVGVAGEDLREHIDQALEDRRMEGDTVAVHVVDIESGEVLHSRRADVPMIPASNQKIITTAAALSELGPLYEFRTRLCIRGQIDDEGVLEGDLLLRGGGDPTPGSVEFREYLEERKEREEDFPTLWRKWAERLAERGLRRVRGEVIVDDRFFDRRHLHPDWPRAQIWRKYCPTVAALVHQDSCVGVSVKPGETVGDPARVILGPPVPGLQIANTCITKPERHAIWFDREAGSPLIRVGGYVRHESVGYSGRVTVPEPALFAGRAFAHQLKRTGIELQTGVRLVEDERPAESGQWRRLFERRVPLTDVLRVMLTGSENLYAEQVVKTIGAVKSGEGSWKAGLARMAGMLRGMGGAQDSFHLADGSGMSRKNRLTAELICRVLSKMADLGEKDFSGLLAAPGEGTLRRRFRTEPYRTSIRAKTGFLRKVGALCGYARTSGGGRVVFSILINDFTGGSNPDMKQIEDAVVRAIIDHAD
jgi:D-alanyl-D-alanine carboxypeptidase/D-alanyl-D-alanine-endopeptidase (penicillin-binding protein 4)